MCASSNQLLVSKRGFWVEECRRRLSAKATPAVGVGITVARDPLHGSGRAELPHPALASGNDAQAVQLPDVPAPAHCARRFGAVSETRFAGADSPWPVPFPPSPPPPVARLCSQTSQVLRNCPTSCARSSSACVLRLPDAACGSISRRRTQDLPVLEQGVSVHAQGLRPREARPHLAISMRSVWPSATSHGVGSSKVDSFAAQYLACTCPCQRFGSSSWSSPHDSGSAWVASPSPYGSFIHYTSPVYPGARDARPTVI